MTLSTAQIIYFFPWFLLIAQLKRRASLSRVSLLERAAMKPRHAAALAFVGSLSLRARGETHMNSRHPAVILSVLVLALSGCAQQQPSAFETALPKLRDQCEAGVTQACQKIAQGACQQGTPETCRAECWPANVAKACAEYRPEDTRPALPGGSTFLPREMTPF